MALPRPRVLLVGGLGLAVAGLAGFMSRPATEAAVAATAARGEPAGFPALAALVREYRACWRDRGKDRVVAVAQQKLPGLLPAVEWVLQRPAHDCFPGVAELAAACPLVEVRELLVAAAHGDAVPERRAVAVGAAERIHPLGPEELDAFLGDSSAIVVVATLQALAGREERPLDRLLPLLDHPQAEVRQAAFAALPAPLPAEAHAALLALADRGGEAAEPALRALAAADWTPPVQQALFARLPHAEPALQTAILDGCARQHRLPEPVAPVWELVRSDGPLPLRAKALQCLTGEETCDLASLRAELPSLPPRLRYLAARCLVQRGDRDGVALLLELAEQPEVPADDQLAAKEVLARLSGKPLHHGVAVWREWFESGAALPATVDLPAVPF